MHSFGFDTCIKANSPYSQLPDLLIIDTLLDAKPRNFSQKPLQFISVHSDFNRFNRER